MRKLSYIRLSTTPGKNVMCGNIFKQDKEMLWKTVKRHLLNV